MFMKVSKIKSISLERKRIYKINEIENVAGYGKGGVFVTDSALVAEVNSGSNKNNPLHTFLPVKILE